MATLSSSEIDIFLKTAPAWKLDSGKLVRDWEFADFIHAMAFVNRVAELAEAVEHHPDIDIRYNKVRLGLISHDSGGITQRDTKMSARIDRELK